MTSRYTTEGQLIHDTTIRFQVYLERLKSGNLRDIDKVIREFDAAVRALLEFETDNPSRARVEKLIKVLRERMTKISDKYVENYLRTLNKFSNYALTTHEATMLLLLPDVAQSLISISKAAAWAGILSSPIQATGTLLETFVESWSTKAIERVEGAIRVGYAQGKSSADILRTIRGTKKAQFTDGILGGVTKREANAMIRTSLQHVSNQAQQMIYDDNNDIVEGYIWVSTLDGRTSQQCRSLDGEVFKTGKGPVPPIHVNCRSTTIPKLKGIDLLSKVTRASKNGQVSATTTYYDWLKTQSAEFQNDALGVTRAKIFREGGISAEQFRALSLDKNFQPLTLDEMRKKNPAIFNRLGL